VCLATGFVRRTSHPRIPCFSCPWATRVWTKNVPCRALPEIQRQFHASPDGEQWVITSSLLSMAMCMPAAGRFADHFGRKRRFLLGAAVFGCSSALCAVASTLGSLIAARFPTSGDGRGAEAPRHLQQRVS
jgi:MFS family permease